MRKIYRTRINWGTLKGVTFYQGTHEPSLLVLLARHIHALHKDPVCFPTLLETVAHYKNKVIIILEGERSTTRHQSQTGRFFTMLLNQQRHLNSDFILSGTQFQHMDNAIRYQVDTLIRWEKEPTGIVLQRVKLSGRKKVVYKYHLTPTGRKSRRVRV